MTTLNLIIYQLAFVPIRREKAEIIYFTDKMLLCTINLYVQTRGRVHCPLAGIN